MIRYLLIALIFLSFLSTSASAAIGKNGYRKSTGITTGQVSCGTTQVLIFAADSARQGFILHNDSGSDLYIGPTGLTTANGFIMSNHETVADSGLHNFIGALYCRTASGTQTLNYMTIEW